MDYDLESLNNEYNKVGHLTWLESDFKRSWLQSSRDLFDDDSLSAKVPTPKNLEVYALVSGLEFSKKMQDIVANLQLEIDKIIGPSITRYWVEPKNLGVEYCVFKWPDQQWDVEIKEGVCAVLREVNFTPFNLYICGIQINRDGCVILKGYDQFQTIQNIRKKIKSSLQFLPEKQSRWAHVPIGRILDPVGESKFIKLQEFVSANHAMHFHTEMIDDAKFVHEKQWYMVQREVIMRIYQGE